MAKPGDRKKNGMGKVGSDPEAARHAVGGKGDFGVPVDKGRTRDLDYVSENTKHSDRGAAQPKSSEFDGLRTHGAGGIASGDGTSSGGDLDPDIIGVGGTGGIAASGPDERPGVETDGSTRGRASGPPAPRENQNAIGKVTGSREEYRTIARAMAEGGREQEGADAATNPEARGDDAFMGEVSSDESQDADKPTQGDP
jgi:hypothetical protein